MKYIYGVITAIWAFNLISFILSGEVGKLTSVSAMVIVILVFAQFTVDEIIKGK